MALWDHKSSDTLGIMRSELWRANAYFSTTYTVFRKNCYKDLLSYIVFFRWKCSHRKTNHGNSKDNITLLTPSTLSLPVLSSVGKEPVTIYNANVVFLQFKSIAYILKYGHTIFMFKSSGIRATILTLKWSAIGGKASPLRILLCVRGYWKRITK